MRRHGRTGLIVGHAGASFLLICAAATAQDNAPTTDEEGEATGDQPPAYQWGKYQTLHFTQDYTGLIGMEEIPARDWADELKYIPLNDEGDIFLSLGGQARFRYEGFNNFEFGSPDDDDDEFYFLHRYFLWSGLNFGENFRVFVEGKSAFTEDRDLPGGRRTLDTDSLDLQNAFAELTIPGDNGLEFLVRGGRQELLYGAQRLVSPLDWSNTRRSWEGVLGRVTGEAWKVDAFWTQFVPVDKYDFNEADEDHDFWGVYATFDRMEEKNLSYDAYFLTQSLDGAVETDRYTIGTRIWGGLGETDFGYEIEGGYQFGEVGDLDIQAWFLTAELNRVWEDMEWQPRITAGFDYASGDDDPTDGDSGTFSHLYPLGHAYLGYIDIVGRQNILDLRLSGRVSVTDKLWLRADWHNFWRAEDDDALYNAGGGVVRAPAAGADDFVGVELDFTAGYTIDHHWNTLFGYSHFFPGDFIDDTGEDDAIDFWYAQAQFTF